MRSFEIGSYDAAVEGELTGQDPIRFEIAYWELEPEEVGGKPTPIRHIKQFECHGEITGLMLSELAFNEMEDIASSRARQALRRVFRGAFGNDDLYYEFLDWTASHAVPNDTMVAICRGLVVDFSGRPTVRPSSSATSQSEHGQGSKESGSLATVRRLPLMDRKPLAEEELAAASSG